MCAKSALSVVGNMTRKHIVGGHSNSGLRTYFGKEIQGIDTEPDDGVLLSNDRNFDVIFEKIQTKRLYT